MERAEIIDTFWTYQWSSEREWNLGSSYIPSLIEQFLVFFFWNLPLKSPLVNLFTKRAISSYEGVSSDLSSSSYSSSSSSSSNSSSLAFSARFEDGPPYVARSLLDSFRCSSYCKKVAITSSGVILKKSGICLNSHTI